MKDLENMDFHGEKIQDEVNEAPVEEIELTLTEKNRQERAKQAQWYIIKTSPSKEEIVLESIQRKMKNPIIGDSIFDVKIIYHNEIVERRGKRKTVLKKVYPSYVFIKMIYSKEIWWEVISTEYVHSFLGPNGRPLKLRPEEIRRNRLEEDVIQKIEFSVGDNVKSIDEAFGGVQGVIKEIDQENQKAYVGLNLFGREIPCWLHFSKLEKQ